MREKILIVDDVEINRMILSTILEDNYDILQAEDGVEALQVLGACDVKPHAVLLDIIMPRMDGFETLQQLKSNPDTQKIPVLFITAADADETESKGLQEGAADYISKPFNPEVVKARVKNHIELYRYQNDLEHMVIKKTADLVKTHEQMLEIMATIIEYRSLESGMHIQRTRDLTKIMLDQMALMPEFQAHLGPTQLDAMHKAVVLHDIGKVGIPDNILLKPGRLTPEEYEIMKTHTIIGGNIVDGISSELTEDTIYLERCKEICRHHHEHWSGRGYPDQLAGEQIPLSARILAIVDVYEALVSERCYKNAMTPDEAAKIIEDGAGTQFDPHIVRAFIAIKDKFAKLVTS